MKKITNPEIGDRPISLASHLRNVALIIQTNPSAYNWGCRSQCNAGLLFRSVLGIAQSELCRQLASAGVHPITNKSWSECVAELCPINPGVKAPEFFMRLEEAGVLRSDIAHIEYLSHPEIRAGLKREITIKKFFGLFKENKTIGPDNTAARDVANYFNAWADRIEQFHNATSAPSSAVLNQIEERPLVS